MIKYSLGMDVSSKTLDVCFCSIDLQQQIVIKGTRKFSNQLQGFKELVVWIEKHYKQKELPLAITMEATGVYYEASALYLFKHGYSLAVVLPNKAKKFFQASGLKSKNDKIDAKGIAQMGAEKALALWKPMDDYFYRLRALTRHLQSLHETKTSLNNQLHAIELSMHGSKDIIKQLQKLINTITSQIDEIKLAIQKHIASNESVQQKVDRVSTIKGVSLSTIAVVIAETNGFALFNNSSQLVSYAGYDIVESQSGKRIGRTKISKKGNSQIRRALHMPAFVTIKYQVPLFYNLYQRTFARHGIKMKSFVAVQKKLLVLIYTLWKNNTSFDPDYNKSVETLEKRLQVVSE